MNDIELVIGYNSFEYNIFHHIFLVEHPVDFKMYQAAEIIADYKVAKF